MSFYNQFMQYFTPQEQQTDVVKMWATIGCNAEKTLIEEMSAQGYEISDVNNFTEETYKSWLGFFMRKIRNRVAPKVKATITITSAKTTVDIPSGTELNSPNGTYLTQKSLSLTEGQSVVFSAIQGKLVTETITNYHDFISIRAKNIDLDTIKLVLGGVEIKEIEYNTSYTSMEYLGSCYVNEHGQVVIGNGLDDSNILTDTIGKKGQFYTVISSTSVGNNEAIIADESLSILVNSKVHKGNRIIYDGKYWTLDCFDNSLMPYQLEFTRGNPRNGYYAYCSDEYLYIKVFKGVDVQDPEGLNGILTYISTDGVQGECQSNTLKFTNNIRDINGEEVEFTIQNDKSTNGLNEITRGQLNMLLRQNFYTNVSISSVPEYMAWFNAQPEVGSCYVYGDFEEFLRTGLYPSPLTGRISVLLLDRNGNDISNNITLVQSLLERIQPYKDIGFIEIVTVDKLNVEFQVRYYSCTDDVAFKALVKSTINNYFNTDYLRQHGLTLFENLDITQIIRDIGNQYSVQGLTINCYHYLSEVFPTEINNISMESTTECAIGGAKYYYREQIDSNDGKAVYASKKDSIVMWETVGSNRELAYIYARINGDDKLIGTRTNKGITISQYFKAGKLEVLLPTKDVGILSLGASNMCRVIHDETDSIIEAIDVAKYSQSDVNED